MTSEEKAKDEGRLERRGAAAPTRPAPARPTPGQTKPAKTQPARASGQTRPAPKRRERMSHERRVLLMALASAAPAVVVSLALLWAGPYEPKTVWTLATLIV